MNTSSTMLRRRSAESGVTMIELMVSLLLGMLLIGGAVQVFTSNRAAFGFNEGFSRVQENGRFGLDTIGYHARLAGYLGCRSGVPVFNNLVGPTSLAFNLEQAVFGYEANGTAPGQTYAPTSSNPNNTGTASAGNWTPSLPAPGTSGNGLAGGVIPGSDVLVVRHVNPVSYALLSPFSSATLVTATAPATAFEVGDIAVASDCQKASVFQVTAIGAVAGGITLAHTTGTGSPRNATITWNTDQQYAAGAQVARGETWAFYVARSAAGRPALFQRRLVTNAGTMTSSFAVAGGAAEELADGVETMQVRYGLDMNLDGAIDQYATAANVGAANWPRVAAVRVTLLVRSPDEYGTETDAANYDLDGVTFNPFGSDRRVRQVFTSTIAIRNRLP